MTVYLTRYALTYGIYKADGAIDPDDEHWFRYRLNCGGDVPLSGNVRKPDWHATSEAALARAEEMRRNKIASLRKHIERLEQLKITCPE